MSHSPGAARLRVGSVAYIEVTNRCNLACSYCCAANHQSPRDMPMELLEGVRNFLAGLGVTRTVVTGGEPTLHPDFEGIVGELVCLGSVCVTTNGVGFPSRRAASLLRRSPVVQVQVSIDGLSAETVAKTRGRAAHPTALQLVESLCAEGFNRQVAVSITVSAANIGEVGRLIEYIERIGVGAIHFPQLIPAGRASGDWSVVAPPVGEMYRLERLLLARYGATLPRVSVNRLDRVAAWLVAGPRSDCLVCPTLKIGVDGGILVCPCAWSGEHQLAQLRPGTTAEDMQREVAVGLARVRLQHPCPADGLPRTCESCGVIGPGSADAQASGAELLRLHLEAAKRELGSAHASNVGVVADDA